MKDSRKWARLIVCVAFHVIFTGLAGAVLSNLAGISRPGPILFIPSFAAAGLVGWFYTYDRTGSRVAEAGNLAGALAAVRLWVDFNYLQPGSGLGAADYFTSWYVWISYLANVLVILAAGWFNERRRVS